MLMNICAVDTEALCCVSKFSSLGMSGEIVFKFSVTAEDQSLIKIPKYSNLNNTYKPLLRINRNHRTPKNVAAEDLNRKKNSSVGNR